MYPKKAVATITIKLIHQKFIMLDVDVSKTHNKNHEPYVNIQQRKKMMHHSMNIP